jgi:ABC-type Fe3+/spermidine/putrescine transport system ATPase subunit
VTIRVQSLVKTFGGRAAVDNVSFDVAEGEFVSLLGPSGCGKTTTLRCIAGLETPEEGQISIGTTLVNNAAAGVAVPPYRRNIGMVFQSYAIWPHMSVFENVAFPLRIKHVPRAEIATRVKEALRMVGLEALAERSAQQLSGGQQQRVAVARAIVQSPEVMLFDEPLSNLDAALRDQTRAEIRRLQRDLGIAAIYVTHDQAEALSISDRIIVMDQGRIVQVGTPGDIYSRPANEFVAKVVGAANFLDVTVTPNTADEVFVELDGGTRFAAGAVSTSGSYRLMLRPDRLALSRRNGALKSDPGQAHLEGTVRQRLFVGGYYEYLVPIHGGQLRVFSREDFAEGAPVWVSFEHRDSVLVQKGATS